MIMMGLPRGVTAVVALLVACALGADPAAEPGSKRLVVLAGPRTGSSLLVAMLRAHRKQILMHGEPFHEQDLRGTEKDGFDGGVQVPDAIFSARHSAPGKLLEHVAAEHRGREVVGFKLFQKHLELGQLPELLKWATHLVWLRRRNALAQYVSVCLAQRSRIWVAYERGTGPAANVSLSGDFFRLWLYAEKQYRAYTTGIVSLLEVEGAAPAVLSLEYERDLCSLDLYNETTKKLERFLGLRPTTVVPRLPIKQHDQGLAALVANWETPEIRDIAAPYDATATCRAPVDLDALLNWRRRTRRRRLDEESGLSPQDRARRLCIEGREQNHANTAQGIGI